MQADAQANLNGGTVSYKGGEAGAEFDYTGYYVGLIPDSLTLVDGTAVESDEFYTYYVKVDDSVSYEPFGGAVDYVTKPFNTKELLARIAVHLRTFDTLGKSEVLTFEEISLDTNTHIASVKNEEIKLTRTEYAILKLLLQNQTQVVAKSQLLDRISEDTPDCTESSLKTHISNLRKKLRDAGGKDYIEAIWGIGFKMKTE